MYVHQGDTGKSGHGRGDFAVRDAPLASILRKDGGEGGEGRGGGGMEKGTRDEFRRNSISTLFRSSIQ